MRDFCKVISALGHWCPVLIEADFFPAIVFPFVKIAKNDLICAFEIVVSLVLNWLYSWFENFPEPPVKYVLEIEDLIKAEEPKLVKHLKDLGISPTTYIWPILKYLFTQVITKDEFCVLIDHIFANFNRPEFLVCISAGYILYYKSTLLSIENSSDIEGFFVQQNPINMMKLLKLSGSLLSKSSFKECRIPIPEEYPKFTNYPEFAVKLQTSIRDRWLQQDQEYFMKKQYIDDINKKFVKLEEEELKIRREQETLLQAENERRKVAILEENLRLNQRKNLDEEAKRVRLSQIQRIEETIEKSLKSQENMRKKELISIEEEIRARADAEKYYSSCKQEEENLSLLEFKAAQRLLELMRIKNAEESMRKLKLNAQH